MPSLESLQRQVRPSRGFSREIGSFPPATDKPSPKTARLLKRLRKIEELPAADHRTVLKLLDALHESRQRTARPARSRAAG